MLPQSLRIPSPMILPLLRRGKKVKEEAIDLVFERTPTKKAFAVIVPTKVDKRATRRNRMKRLIRESVAILLPAMTTDITGVMVVRGSIPDTQHEVLTIVRRILIKADVIAKV
jgi:ribonuclease P protein component